MLSRFERLQAEDKIKTLQSFLSDFFLIAHESKETADYEREFWAIDYYNSVKSEIELLEEKL